MALSETEAKIDASNVMILDKKNKPTRIYTELDKNNKKVRVSKAHEKLD